MVSRGSRSFPGPHPASLSETLSGRVSFGFGPLVMSTPRSGSSTRRGVIPIIVMRSLRRSVVSGPMSSTSRPSASNENTPDSATRPAPPPETGNLNATPAG